MQKVEHAGMYAGNTARRASACFAGWNPTGRVREKDAALVVAHPAANRQSAGEQGSSARGAHRSRSIKVGPFLSFASHPVQIGRPDGRMTVAAQISVAKIVSQDD